MLNSFVLSSMPPGTRRAPFTGAGFAILAAALVLAGCREVEPVAAVNIPEPRTVPLAVVQVEPRPFTNAVAITGTLVSRSRVDVKAETTGRVLRFPKEEGDRVQAGEAVAWVDETNYKIALAQADSAVKVAEAALDRARVMESHSRTEQERAENLVRSGGITDRDLKAAQLAARDAAAQVSLASAQLEQARVGLESAAKRLRDTVIRAPVAGEIQTKFVNEGAYVEPPTPVFTLVDNTRLELESQVAAADLAPIRAGQKVTFTVSSYPDTVFEGGVAELSPAVEAQSRSAKVRIKIENRGGVLKAGMFAQGEILTGVEAGAIVLPAVAVYRSDGAAKESYVFVVEDGKAVRRAIRIGREQNGMLVIASGLKAGELIVAQQSIELADGVRVQPLEPGK